MDTDNKFNYQMLSRLQMDCDYFLGCGKRNARHLWAGNVKDQIAEMYRLYKLVPIKPDWLTYQQIEKYEKEM